MRDSAHNIARKLCFLREGCSKRESAPKDRDRSRPPKACQLRSRKDGPRHQQKEDQGRRRHHGSSHEGARVQAQSYDSIEAPQRAPKPRIQGLHGPHEKQCEHQQQDPRYQSQPQRRGYLHKAPRRRCGRFRSVRRQLSLQDQGEQIRDGQGQQKEQTPISASRNTSLRNTARGQARKTAVSQRGTILPAATGARSRPPSSRWAS